MALVFSSPWRTLHHLSWRLWWLKATGSAAFIWAFFQAYFYLLRMPHAEVHVMPLTWIDQHLPMQAWAWVPYLSLWVYACLPPALMPNLRTLVYYGVAVGLVSLVGLVCFYFWPTVIPEPVRPPGTELALLRGVDTTGNACPSLHVAIAIYSGFWMQSILRTVRAGAVLHTLSWAWSLAIVYSTLATKQHVVWDVVGGLLLGCGGAALMLIVYARTGLRPSRHSLR